MSKIFILGMSPLPFENDRKVYGTGIRTWQFVLPLLERGHKLCVCNYAVPSAYPDDFESWYEKDFIYTNKIKHEFSFEYNVLNKDDFENVELLSKIFLRFKPDCVVGCTFYPSYIASKLLNYLRSSTVPFWADLFGHVMAEAQARAYIDGDDSCLFHYWNSEYNIVLNADKFSCVSSRQEYALIGELGAAGRLNRYTSGYEFSCTIPCGLPKEEYMHTKNVFREKSDESRSEIEVDEIDGNIGNKIQTRGVNDNLKESKINEYGKSKGIINGSEEDKNETGELKTGKDGIRIRKDDFVVLWTGGYNTWTDVGTLFKGLTLAMKENPMIEFVSTGGEIPEQDTKTYPGFLEMIENSPYRNRFIMKGWIAGEDVPNYYLESDVGINIDKDIYEVRLGSKNRILDWMRAGLCVLSSNVCELTEIIDREKIGYTFKAGDSEDLSEKILYLASHPVEVKKTALAGKKYGFSEFNFDRTTEKLQKWVENPASSPDRGRDRKIFFDKEEALKNMDQIVLRQKKMIEERDRRILELEVIVKKSFIYRLYGYLKIIRRKLSG